MFGNLHSEQAAMSGLDRPAMAKVLLLNDEETTMEFVVEVSRGNSSFYV